MDASGTADDLGPGWADPWSLTSSTETHAVSGTNITITCDDAPCEPPDAQEELPQPVEPPLVVWRLPAPSQAPQRAPLTRRRGRRRTARGIRNFRRAA